MKKQRNKLAAEKWTARMKNFLLNFFWAVVWLGRWGIKITRRLLNKIKKD